MANRLPPPPREFNWARMLRTLSFWALLIVGTIALVQLASSRRREEAEITYTQFIYKVGRDLPVLQAFHCQGEMLILWRRGNRVASLRLVTVFGCQTEVDMLAGTVTLPAGDI